MLLKTRRDAEGWSVTAEPSTPTGVDRSDEGYNPVDVRTAELPAAGASRSLRAPKRLLALAGDERLVEQIRRGNEAAFEVAFERHGPAILSYCRHMLASREEAEDAVQHVFAAAHGAIVRDDRPIKLKPWLFTIARNRCLSVLRARRDERSIEDHQPASAGLSEQVERRAELRELLEDLGDLPEEQRAALLLAELGDLSHAEVAGVLGCEVPKVKALVFRARSGLLERKEARETPCEIIQEQLANLRGGALRRSELRHHLRSCPGCREYRDQLRRQRQMLAAALPVTPSLGLKSAVLGSVGYGGASAAGGAAGGTGVLAGLGAASGPVAGTVAKVAVVGALAGGAALGGERALDGPEKAPPATTPAAETAPQPGSRDEATPQPVGPARPGERGRSGLAPGRERAAARRKRGKARGRARRGLPAPAPGRQGLARGHQKPPGGRVKPEPRGPRARPPAANGSPQGKSGGAGKGSATSPVPPVSVPMPRPPAVVPRAPRSRAHVAPAAPRKAKKLGPIGE
jgi:RNA polymerase sigma factor (sigma-70 family)